MIKKAIFYNVTNSHEFKMFADLDCRDVDVGLFGSVVSGDFVLVVSGVSYVEEVMSREQYIGTLSDYVKKLAEPLSLKVESTYRNAIKDLRR